MACGVQGGGGREWEPYMYSKMAEQFRDYNVIIIKALQILAMNSNSSNSK
jgi:hypothetical protein